MIRSIPSSMQCFLGIIGIALIRWISLQAKTTFFVGQNLDAKNYTYFDTERVSYTTYGPNSTKPSKEAPNAKESFSPSLLIARPEPPSPRLRVRPSAPPALGFEPFAFGPRPIPWIGVWRHSGDRHPALSSWWPPQLGNGNSGRGKPQAPRRPSASTPASVRRRPPPVIIRTVQQRLVVATACWGSAKWRWQL